MSDDTSAPPVSDNARLDACPGHLWMNGAEYMPDSRGRLTPIELVKTQDLLQDDVVRRLFAAAQAVSKVLVDFKVNTFADVDAFNEILAERYGAPKGGEKGNITLTSYDSLVRMKVQIGDRFEFGPEIKAAKALVDQCLEEWSEGGDAKIRLIVMDAFDVDKEGKLNRSKLLGLLRLEVDDQRWKRAMEALKDSIRIVGSCRYILFHSRPNLQAPWVTLSLSAADA